ncbi:hypothetical protein GBA52_015269 [Prunus armeniaca]|nr:hypothetical protein GBA52_015269 [Prunus armeniaca]
MASVTRSNPKLDIPIINLASDQFNVGQTFKALSMVIDTRDGKNPHRCGSLTLTGLDFGAKRVSGTGIPGLENSQWVWGGDGIGVPIPEPDPKIYIFGAGMGDSPPTGKGTGILQNLLNGDGFGDGGGDGKRGRRWYCHTQPLPDLLPSLIDTKHGKILGINID